MNCELHCSKSIVGRLLILFAIFMVSGCKGEGNTGIKFFGTEYAWKDKLCENICGLAKISFTSFQKICQTLCPNSIIANLPTKPSGSNSTNGQNSTGNEGSNATVNKGMNDTSPSNNTMGNMGSGMMGMGNIVFPNVNNTNNSSTPPNPANLQSNPNNQVNSPTNSINLPGNTSNATSIPSSQPSNSTSPPASTNPNNPTVVSGP